jgi:alpha-tubulin suppressor-like RCC1 family protein/outer membrane protein OmpA-like peptidoglycan-associated protein
MKNFFLPIILLLSVQLVNATNFYSQKIVKIAAGSNHSLAIDSQGNLWTWGCNSYGQLGDGTTKNRYIPVLIMEGKKFMAIAAGESHSLAIDTDGTLWAVGDNRKGQLGDGTTIGKNYMVKVKTANKFVTVAAKGSHSLAIDANKTLWAFGNNEFGQLGDSTKINKIVPVAIKKGTHFISISTGWAHSHAIDERRALWAFGDNRYGQLGVYNGEASIAPVRVLEDKIIADVDDGIWFTLAIDSSNSLWAFGDNNYVQNGNGTDKLSNLPVQVSRDTLFKKASSGLLHGLAIDNNNFLWAFGNNDVGQLGDSTSNAVSKRRIVGTTKFQSIESGLNHNLAIDENGDLWVFGSNEYGQLGNGTNQNKYYPEKLNSRLVVKKISSGIHHGLILDVDGNLYAYGSDSLGQLGVGIMNGKVIMPIPLMKGVKFSDISAGIFSSYAIDEYSYIWAWGSNDYGQLGDGTKKNKSIPVRVKSEMKFINISSGMNHVLAIDINGNLWGFGDNSYGQLGIENQEAQYILVKIINDKKFKSISTGDNHSLAIDSIGNLWVFGYNEYGQLGTGDIISKLTPVQILPDLRFKEISASNSQSFAIDIEGNLWTFGLNWSGQLGDGTYSYKDFPVLIEKGTKFKKVSSGKVHTLAQDVEGNMWSFGNNSFGQIGNKIYKKINVPVKIFSGVNVKNFYAGPYQSYFIDEFNTFWAFGKNENGDLLNGSVFKMSSNSDERTFQDVLKSTSKIIQEKDWNGAVKSFQYYRPQFPTMGDRFEKTIRLFESGEDELVIKNMGSSINSDASEFLPLLTFDGKKMYFTGLKRKGGEGWEDIFVSEFSDGNWSEAMGLGSDMFNSVSSKAAIGISADGNRLFLFGNFKPNLGRGDICYSDQTYYGWSPIQHFPEPVNSQYFDCDAFNTSDGMAMLFVSERPGGIGDYHEKDEYFNGHSGNSDIYVCTKTDSGWSDPINLGIMINTPYDERTPFLHPDGKTLYFSSDGHYGLGSHDVFKTVRLNDTLWTEWSEPINLGKGINSTGSDWGYRISTDGTLAYFSASERSDGFGKGDIYSVTLPEMARPEAVVTISGKVTDEKWVPLETAIKWDNLTTQQNVGELKSNPENGNYFIVLPLGKKYGYFAEKEGYYSASKNIDLTNDSTSKNLTENIILYSIEKMKTNPEAIVINNIFFDFNKFELKPESFPELNRLTNVLISNPGTKVEIDGYTDNVGTVEYNNTLSLNRAKAVVGYLISKGCKPTNLVAKGNGQSNPIADNSSEEGKAKNRRVEFKFLKN